MVANISRTESSCNHECKFVSVVPKHFKLFTFLKELFSVSKLWF